MVVNTKQDGFLSCTDSQTCKDVIDNLFSKINNSATTNTVAAPTGILLFNNGNNKETPNWLSDVKNS